MKQLNLLNLAIIALLLISFPLFSAQRRLSNQQLKAQEQFLINLACEMSLSDVEQKVTKEPKKIIRKDKEAEIKEKADFSSIWGYALRKRAN